MDVKSVRKPAKMWKTREYYSVGTAWQLLVGRLHFTREFLYFRGWNSSELRRFLGVFILRNWMIGCLNLSLSGWLFGGGCPIDHSNKNDLGGFWQFLQSQRGGAGFKHRLPPPVFCLEKIGEMLRLFTVTGALLFGVVRRTSPN